MTALLFLAGAVLSGHKAHVALQLVRGLEAALLLAHTAANEVEAMVLRWNALSTL